MPLILFALFVVLLGGLPCQAGWQLLFNGKDLTGWSGDPRLWRVEDGVLIGESNDGEKKIDANSFLIWQGGELGDFELEFKARVTGDNNSGVQYRSRILDPAKWEVAGYQIDLHPQPSCLGMLYESLGRGAACERGQQVKLDETPVIVATFEVPAVDLAAWNSYRIVAQGTQLRHFVNGKLAAEIEDIHPSKRAVQGVVALQLHSGAAMKVEFKDMRVQQGTKARSKGEAPAAWIWNSEPPVEKQTMYFRRQFQLPPDVQRASVTMMCDDSHILYFNGQEIARDRGWETCYTYDVLSHLKQDSQNVIAVRAENEIASAGMIMRFRATLKDGSKLYIVTDHNWLCSSEGPDAWATLDFQAVSWQKAHVVGKMGEDPWPIDLISDPSENITEKAQ